MVSESISGYVGRVVFNRDDFYILAFNVATSKPPVARRTETARGNLFGLLQVKSGTPLRLLGEWKDDPKYGRQFVVHSWDAWAQSSHDVTNFLHTCVSGFVDIELASLLGDSLGTQAFAQLSINPGQVQEDLRAKGVSEDDAQAALLGWAQTIATRDISGMLREGGLGVMDVQAAILRFGMAAPSVIRENPYRLMEIPSLSFVKVDQLAQSLGVSFNDARRVEGAILWAVHSAARSGHMFLPRNEVVANVNALLVEHHLVAIVQGDHKSAFLTALQNLIRRKALVLDPKVGLYAPDLYEYERKSASILADLLVSSALSVDLHPFLAEYERTNRISLSAAQKEAVSKLAEHHVLVLTGLPGTGKTTAVRVLVRAFEASGVNFALMAPTGIAGKRLSAVTGHEATTIHRGLKFNGSEWGHHETNRLLYDAVIVDEVSMVDQELIYRLLVALRPDARLVLVGDDAQLPSVGPGNVLRELAGCAAVPTVRLTQIFRQSDKGEIVVNAHCINRGEMISVLDRQDSEFRFIRMSNEEAIVRLIVEMATKLKAKNANFQVLSPKYDGVVGVTNLNERLRDRLNPEGPKEWQRGDQHFRLGDRVMIIKNDHKRGVYNGDVGKLVGINRNQLIVKVHGLDTDMEVEFDDQAAEDKLRLAYAVTVHKSQGNEFDTIILPITTGQGRMLQRNLLYTAVTRARQRVWLLGDETAVRRAVENNRVLQRNTALSHAVLEAVRSGVDGSEEKLNEQRVGKSAAAAVGGLEDDPAG